jgi:hypothetical protein
MMDDLFDQIDNNAYTQKRYLANENGKLVRQKSHLHNSVFTGYYDPIYALRTLVFPNNSVSLGESLVNNDTGTNIVVQVTKGAFTNNYDYYNYVKPDAVLDRTVIDPDVVTPPEEPVYPVGYVRRAIIKVRLYGEFDSYLTDYNTPLDDPRLDITIDITTPPFNDFPENSNRAIYQLYDRMLPNEEIVLSGYDPHMPYGGDTIFNFHCYVPIRIIRTSVFLLKFYIPITPSAPFIGFGGSSIISHSELSLQAMQGWYIATFTVLWTPYTKIQSDPLPIPNELEYTPPLGRYNPDKYVPVEETYTSLPFIWEPYGANPKVGFGDSYNGSFRFRANSAVPIHIDRNGIYDLKDVQYQSVQPVKLNKWRITYFLLESDVDSGIYTTVGRYVVETPKSPMPENAIIEITTDVRYQVIILKVSLPAGANNAKHLLTYYLYANYTDVTKQNTRIDILNVAVI